MLSAVALLHALSGEENATSKLLAEFGVFSSATCKIRGSRIVDPMERAGYRD